MGCGCGKSTQPMAFVHVDDNGTETPKANEVQARAAVIRFGGTWEKRPADTAKVR